MLPSGVTESQSAAMVAAATTPIGSARRFSIQGDGGWRNDRHGASGTKSGETGMAPKCKRMCSGAFGAAQPSGSEMASGKRQ